MQNELSALFERESAPVAQWIRAADFGSAGRGCESLRARHLLRGPAVVRAVAAAQVLQLLLALALELLARPTDRLVASRPDVAWLDDLQCLEVDDGPAARLRRLDDAERQKIGSLWRKPWDCVEKPT